MNWLTQSAFAIFVLNFSKLSSWKPREREIFSWAHTITIWLQMDKSAIYNKFCVYTSCRVSSNEFLLLFGWIVAVVVVVLVRSTLPPTPEQKSIQLCTESILLKSSYFRLILRKLFRGAPLLLLLLCHMADWKKATVSEIVLLGM